MQSANHASLWSSPKKFWLFFITIYFFFLIWDFTSSDELFPHFVYWLVQPYTNFWDWIVPWTGKQILHLSYPITVKPNGSGDTTYNYVLQILWLIFAFLFAIIWLLIDRRKKSYNTHAYWLRIVMRYYLAFILFVYGFVKIIKLQFPSPDLMRLTETYGDSSPMGLAWTFIGYSKGYNLFIGGAEVLGGILLFFKRTALFGSLIAMTVMMNVAAMNFAYDIPVKLFSVNLVVMATWIAAYDFTRLKNFFFLNKDAVPAKLAMPVQRKWKRILQRSLKVLAIIFALYSTLWSSIETRKEYGDEAPKPPLYGIYNVETFVKRSDTFPPLLTDTIRWKQMIINYPDNIRIKSMADSTKWYGLKIDSIKHTAVITSFTDSTKIFTFRYSKPDKDHLIFSGTAPDLFNKNPDKTDSLIIMMKRFDETKFRLMNRGFNWINEQPYNK